MKLRVKDNFFYPDVMVDCQFDESEPYYTETPVLIVEVLSRSTRKKDETLKFMTYINLPSLQEYVLIDLDSRSTDGYRKGADGLWVLHPFASGESVELASVALTMSSTELYADVL